MKFTPAQLERISRVFDDIGKTTGHSDFESVMSEIETYAHDLWDEHGGDEEDLDDRDDDPESDNDDEVEDDFMDADEN
jgi:hypothetical protein